MTPPITLAVRGIRNNLGRLALTLIAIVLGVGFVSGSFILSDSLGRVFDGIVERANENLDARVQPIADPGFGQLPGQITNDLVDTIEDLPQVESAEGFVSGDPDVNLVVGLGPDGLPALPQDGQGPPILTFGFNDLGSDSSGFTIAEGSPPVGPDQVALNVSQAFDLGLEPGDTATFQTPAGLADLTLTATVEFPGAGAWFTLFDLEGGQVRLNKVGLNDAVSVVAAEGVAPADVLLALEGVLPDNVEAIDQATASQQDSAGFSQFISVFGSILLGFASIAVFVSLFIIYNTFAILVSQRIQQIGMLRAIGANRRQIKTSILFEALLVGILGSVMGIAAGVGVAWLIRKLIESQGGFPEVSTVISLRTVLVSVVVGVVATIISALLPALKASQVSPIQAMRAEGATEKRSKGKIAAGAVILLLGLGAVGYGLTAAPGVLFTLALLGVGAILTFVGVAMLSGLFAGYAVSVLGRSGLVGVLGFVSGILLLFGGLGLIGAGASGLTFGSGALGDLEFGGPDPEAEPFILNVPSGASQILLLILAVVLVILGALFVTSAPRSVIDGVRLLKDSVTNGSERRMARIARENASRSPQRTAATATALMIGLALVTLVSVLAQSLRTSLNDLFTSEVGADVFISNETGQAIAPGLLERIDEVDGVAEFSRYTSNAKVRIGGEEGTVHGVTSFDASTEDRVLNYGVTDGSYADVATGNAVFVRSSAAVDNGWVVGEPLTLEFEDGSMDSFVVSGTFENEGFVAGDFLVDSSVVLERNLGAAITDIGLRVAPGSTLEEVRDSADELAAEFPNVAAFDNERIVEELNQGIGALLIVINGLLGLALVVAFFGVVNTIVLSVLERTREIGLMRAIGMTRGQLMSTIRWEAIMVSLFGTLLGIALGVLFAIAGVRAIPDTIISSVSIPWGTLITIVIMAGLIGVLAAYLPARRAAKLNPLDAISSL